MHRLQQTSEYCIWTTILLLRNIMDSNEFRIRGKEMVDFIADYLDNIRDRKVSHDVSPGYLRELVPDHAPEQGEKWEDIMADVERVIMPGISHWRSPNFHGYYVSGGSFPSIMGDMLSDAFGCIGFSWAASPACTELEILTTDWLGEMIGLPKQFLHKNNGPGGGVIQTAASEAVFLCVLAARNKMIKSIQATKPEMTSHDIIAKLVCYSSDQANSSVHRSGLLASVQMRKLQSDEKFRLNGETFRQAVMEDKAKGLIPFFVCATLGTTGSCSFDEISVMGPICEDENIWLHVDAAYAGSAFVCPEFRHLMEGVEHAETISINPHKWMLTDFDLSVMWIQHSTYLVDAFNVDPIYLKHQNQGNVPDYRHWQIALGRRFRSLKLWFVLRSYGVSGVQKHIRTHVDRAHQFANLLKEDGRFELPIDVIMGLVCFRIKGSNKWSEKLLEALIKDGSIYLIPAYAKAKGKDIYFLRLAINTEGITVKDIDTSFKIVKKCTDEVLQGKTVDELSRDNMSYKPMIDIDVSGRNKLLNNNSNANNIVNGSNS